MPYALNNYSTEPQHTTGLVSYEVTNIGRLTEIQQNPNAQDGLQTACLQMLQTFI